MRLMSVRSIGQKIGMHPAVGMVSQKVILYQNDIIDSMLLVFYFFLYLYYYNARKKNTGESPE